MSNRDGFVRTTSGSLHGMIYELFVLSSANDLVKEFGITKEEAIKKVEAAVAREDYKIAVHPKYAPKDEVYGI